MRCKSSRIPLAFPRNSALWASSLALLILTFTPCRLFDQSDRKEIGPDEIPIVGRDLLTQQTLLGTFLVRGDDLFQRDRRISFQRECPHICAPHPAFPTLPRKARGLGIGLGNPLAGSLALC